MCLILDTNKFSDYLNPNKQDMEPVRRWIREKNGKIVFAHTDQMEKELSKHRKMHTKFHEDRENGRVVLINAKKVEDKKVDLPELKSNDADIIALALEANVKILVSGDIDLHEDFKSIVRGRVYQNRTHKHLLKRDTCP